MLIVGITGQSGAGKTSVSDIIIDSGFVVINADVVSRQVVEHGKPALTELVKEFGQQILTSTSELNRQKLADIVFNDKEKKLKLQNIIFPYILSEIDSMIEAQRNLGQPVVFLDAPTLFESGADSICNKVISVIAPEDIRLKRILSRDGITQEQALSRLKSQNDDNFYKTRSDYIIYNTGSLSELKQDVLKILKLLAQ